MFQYAAGRRLAVLHNTDLMLDPSYLPASQERGAATAREFSLGVFRIQATAMGFRRVSLLQTIWERMQPTSRIIRERGMEYDPRLENAPDNIQLDGYWQSEKYFSGIADQIVDEFTVRVPMSRQDELVRDQIKSCESVAVHIRRGDFVTECVPILVGN